MYASTHFALLDRDISFGNRLQNCPVCVESCRIHQQDNQQGQYVDTPDDKKLLEIANLYGLVNSVTWGYGEEQDKNNEEGCVGCRVPDSEERNAHGDRGRGAMATDAKWTDTLEGNFT